MLHKDAREMAKTYNSHGEMYHESRSNTHGRLTNEYIDMPTTFSLLPKKLKDLNILDAGCGSGIYAIKLAQKGARVYGIDISEKMIEIAKRETPKNLSIEYRIGAIDELPYKNNAFNIVLCTYVLENVKNIDVVFSEFYRVIKKRGVCIFSLSHPLRALGNKEMRDKKEVLVLENYYDSSERISDFGGGMKVKKFKRTLETYCTAALRAGFVIDGLLEPRPLPRGRLVDPYHYELAMRLPQLLTIRLKK